jgi:hypothetical protein
MIRSFAPCIHQDLQAIDWVRSYWVFANMSERELPMYSSISFGDDRTWQLEYIMGAPADVPHRGPSTPPTDATMEDILSSSMQLALGSSRSATCHPTPDPYMQDILQHLQGISLRQHDDREYYNTRFNAIDGRLDSLNTEIGSLRSEVQMKGARIDYTAPKWQSMVLGSTSGRKFGRTGSWAVTHQRNLVRVHLIRDFEPSICIPILNLIFLYLRYRASRAMHALA